jgi:hypothetical protein
MLRRTAWLVALAVAGAAVPAYGAVKLEWKLKEGDKFYVEEAVKQKQTTKAMGMEQKFTMDLKIVYRFTVKKKTKDGIVLEQKVETAEAKSTGGEGAEVTKLFERLKGAVFTVTLDPAGKLTNFQGYQEHVQKIAKEDKKEAKMFKTVMPEDTFKQGVLEVFSFLPGKPVSPGDKWTQTLRMPMGPLGAMKAVNRYTYQGKAKEGEKIDLTADMTFEINQGDTADLGFKITKGDLKADRVKGSILFDAERGRLARYRLNALVKGKLTLEVQKLTIDAEMEQETTADIRVLDKAPSDD